MSRRTATIKLKGGLGNQLFQVAVGLYLKRQGYNCVYDLTTLHKSNKRVTKRNCEITCFPLEFSSRGTLMSILDYFKVLLSPNFMNYEEFIGNLDGKLSQNLIVNGFFQNGALVDAVICEVVGLILDFEKKECGHSGFGISDAFSDLDSSIVAMHIRRGDYVTLASAKRTHGTLPIEYYREALRRLSVDEKIDELFIFSDDYEWVVNNLQGLEYKKNYVKPSENNPLIDLVKLSKFRRIICANSTFSWWAARIAYERNKTTSAIILPKNWFSDKTLCEPDIFKSDWIRI